MEHLITETLEAVARSQEEQARVLHAECDIALRMAKLLRTVRPEDLPQHPCYTEAAQGVAKEISSYLYTLAEFEEALADTIKHALKELRVSEEE